MAKRIRYNFQQSNNLNVCKFRQASFDLLTDFLVNLNKENKDKLSSLSKCCGNFRDKNVLENILLMTNALSLDPKVGYHANELLQSFMTKHITHLLTTPSPQGASAVQPISYEDAVFDMVKDKFPLIIFSCVQIASKMSLHVNIIDNNTAERFLRSVGLTVTKKSLLDSELMVLKGLDFKLDVANPLIYVEILLEVLGHNEPSVPIELVYDLCKQVLQFVVLERVTIYESLLTATTRSQQPTAEQREKFVSVTEDFMLLGAAVIAAALYIFRIGQWEEVVGELSNITGISRRSVRDFAAVIVLHLTDSSGLS
ncbi:LOW QUALITY PROTEIN: cyclin N-terminal domain-containing protein 1 [Boleophthalmus pectinirostris]|uniref:LOW QUALITY PROTEIN: cyclin N-terminal domain-containing protein 1 n=1 Tax=Boleophthalmus pectinirostris TaxID=150288 RepID=UPI00242E9F11|nr:LOW QUALITY PROTEIN: cyclin N-terminal domain-containing protein 1 [Boleophthalmus pectinirostris]